jgi:hypothetical protein
VWASTLPSGRARSWSVDRIADEVGAQWDAEVGASISGGALCDALARQVTFTIVTGEIVIGYALGMDTPSGEELLMALREAKREVAEDLELNDNPSPGIVHFIQS